MSARRWVPRVGRWAACGLGVLACAAVFRAWLAPENLTSWLLLASFCG